MPFDGSGNFTRDRSWAADAAAGTKIRSDYHDINDDDLAKGLSNCLTKNGATQPLADIPMNAHRIINLGPPIDAQDAATRSFVENFRTFTTSISITGADAAGQVIFTAPTGASGLSWAAAGADLSLVARKGKTDETLNRWVFNSFADASAHPANDVVVIDDEGRINNNGVITNNLSWDGAKWRTIVPGYGALLNYASGGDFRLSSNDTASITNPYMEVTLREFFTAQNSVGNALVTLNKSGPISGTQKYCSVMGQNQGKSRWLIYLGNPTAESGTDRVGSDFDIYCYNNAGTSSFKALTITRSNLTATFGGAVMAPSTFASTGTNLILASAVNGAIFFRPNGAGSSVEQVYIDTAGTLHTSTHLRVGEAATSSYGSYLGCGQQGKLGTSGGYDGWWHNEIWNGSQVIKYVNTSVIGAIAWQCDYRIKKDIAPLPSTWEAVKALNPISYTQKAYDIWVNDDEVRWGFVAHEMQEKLFPGAATGRKDGPDIQSPNLLAIIAGLTKALQEAMLRIEALEAKA
jgi:hypothetical protein